LGNIYSRSKTELYMELVLFVLHLTHRAVDRNKHRIHVKWKELFWNKKGLFRFLCLSDV